MKQLWHEVSKHDYPQPFKKVLLLMDGISQFYVGWYEGETRRLQWYVYPRTYISTHHVIAWAEIPDVPEELRKMVSK